MRHRALAFALALGLSLSSFAQEEEAAAVRAPRRDITVSATRLETPIREASGSVTVITREEILLAGKTSLAEVIRDLAGLALHQSGGPGAAASVSIRGAETAHTLVLLDGLELNDPVNPARTYDLAHFPLDQVERVEVLRGPQSLLYGSDAIGGVINIVTRKGRGRPRVEVSTAGGSLGAFGADLGVSGSSGRASYALGGSMLDTEGISAAASRYPGNTEKDGYRNFSFSGKAGYELARGSSLDFSVRTLWARSDLDNFGGPYGDDPNSSQKYASSLLSGRFRSLSRSGRWEQVLSAAVIRSGRDIRNPEDSSHPAESEEGAYASALMKVDWQNSFFLQPGHTLIAGVEYEREEARSDYVSESPWGAFESRFPSVSARSAGLYVQDKWIHRNNLFLTGGFRADWNSRSGPALTFRVAPAWRLEKTGTMLKATLGTGFKSPSLYQLYAPGTAWGPIGNPELKPERSTGWELGVEQSALGDRITAALAWFGNSFRDLVDFDFALGYVNIGLARTRGLEASLKYDSFRGTGLSASYTRLEARDAISGDLLLRRPRDKFSAAFRQVFPGRTALVVSFLYVGRRLDTDFSSYPYAEILLPGYALLDAAFSVPLTPSWELYARLDNILDAKYEAVWGYGTPGFSVTAGFRLSL